VINSKAARRFIPASQTNNKPKQTSFTISKLGRTEIRQKRGTEQKERDTTWPKQKREENELPFLFFFYSYSAATHRV